MANTYSTMCKAAQELAILAHKNQKRTSGEDYINHCVRVALGALARKDNEIIYCAALLHDSVEDSNGVVTLEMIREQVSPEVAAIVDIMTHRPEVPYMDYIRKISLDPDASVIKVADLFDNMYDLPLGSKRLKKYLNALDYINGMH